MYFKGKLGVKTTKVCLNVYSHRRWINVETTSCVYRVKAKHRLNMIIKYFQTYKRKHSLKIGILKLVVTFFNKIRKKYLGTWKFAKTWKFSVGICLFKVNNRNTKVRCEICSKVKIKTSERRQWRRSGVFILNSEDISHFVLVLLLLLWACKYPLGCFNESIKGCFLLYLFWP